MPKPCKNRQWHCQADRRMRMPLLQGWYNMCPKRTRHIFITDRLTNADVPGPENQAAALAMGNTEKQWHRTYFPGYSLLQVGPVRLHSQLQLLAAPKGCIA